VSYGATDTVSEHPEREKTGPGIRITSKRDGEGWGGCDWVIRAAVERSEESAAAPEPPSAVLRLKYGIDAATFAPEIPIPLAGLVYGISADYLQADVVVRPSATPGEVTATVGALPGRPHSSMASQRVRHTSADVVQVPIPQFATAVVGMHTSPWPPTAAQAARGNWLYAFDSRGVALSQRMPLHSPLWDDVAGAVRGTSAPIGVVTSVGIPVPAGANALELDPSGAGEGAFVLQWLLQG